MVTDEVPPDELFMEYTGTATHLGLFTGEQQLFLNPDGSFTGSIVFTAANGDELWADFSGEYTSPMVDGSLTFTGGTGRFEDATGTVDFEGYTPDGVHITTAFDGWIRY